MRHSRLNGSSVEKNMFIQKSAEVFIYFSSAHAWGRRRSCPSRKRSIPFLRKIFDLYKYSTQTAITFLTESIRRNKDAGLLTAATFMEFRKAFDIWHTDH